MDIHEFKVMPIVQLHASGLYTDIVEVSATLDSLEITGGLLPDSSATEADYDTFFAEGSAQDVSDFIWAQVLFAQSLAPIFCWINLSPLAISRPDVCENLSWLALDPDPRVTGIPGQYADNVGFEVVERGILSEIGYELLAHLRWAMYPVALDDVGSGQHTEISQVISRCNMIGPDKLKFDVSLVDTNSALNTHATIAQWMVDLRSHLALTVEGVPLSLAKYLGPLDPDESVSRYAVPEKDAASWAQMADDIRHDATQRSVTVQLAPMSLKAFLALY